MMLTTDQIAEFHAAGLLVIRGFYGLQDQIVPVQRGIYDVIGQVMARHGIADGRGAFDPASFDAAYAELIKCGRAFGGEIYDAVKQIPSFLRLVAHPQHESVVEQLRVGSLPGIASGGYGIRIDNPFEDKYRALWHQEYPAQLRSLDGIVFWSPLVPILQEMGPVQFCLSSHREGPLPVEVSDPDRSGRSGAYALKLHNEGVILNRHQKVAPLLLPGDVVIVDFFDRARVGS